MGAREAIAAELGAGLRALGVPGCSLAVADADGALWTQGFGLADVRTGRPATAASVYHLFSLTKLLTAAAVMQLVEAGGLALDEPAAVHLSELQPLPHITVRHLLSHSSGLKDSLAAMLAVHFENEPAPDTATALRRYRLSATQPPGRKVAYRNVNYALLGELVTRVGGRPFADHVRERLLAPLGMDVAFSPAQLAGAAATGYMGRWDASRLFLRLRFPATARRLFRARSRRLVALAPYALDSAAIGGLIGPVTGFLPFLRAQLGGGSGVLGADSMALMQGLEARGRAGIEARLGVGLGWKIGEAGGRRFLNHEGGGAGFASEARLYPREGLAIVIAMNRLVGTRCFRLTHRICEALCDARKSLFGRGYRN